MKTWYSILIPETLEINGCVFTTFKLADLKYFDDKAGMLDWYEGFKHTHNSFQTEEEALEFVEKHKTLISCFAWHEFVIQKFYKAEHCYEIQSLPSSEK